MTNKFNYRDLNALRIKNYKENGFLPYLLFFFTAIVSSGLLLLNSLQSYLYIIIVRLIILPLFFATEAMIEMMRNQSVLRFGYLFRCFFLYFTERFRSTFRVIKSTLISLLVYSVSMLTFIVIIYISFYFTNFLDAKTFFEQLNHILELGTMDIEDLLEKYHYLFLILLLSTALPSMFIFAFSFTYLTSKYSISIVYRIRGLKLPGSYFKNVYASMIKENRKLFLKCYWSLNWPIILLFILSFGLGCYIGTIFSLDYSFVFTLGLAMSILVTFTLLGPLFFSNKQAIAEYLSEPYQQQEILLRARYADMLSDILKQMEQEQEDTKKDSDES